MTEMDFCKSSFFFLFFLLVLPSSMAISLNGELISPIIYERNKTIVNHYAITETDEAINISLNGDLLEYITLANVEGNSFDLVIQFPDRYIPAGTYWFGVVVREVADSSAAMGSLLSVSRRFRVEVYSYEKEIEVSLGVPNVNEGTMLPVTLTIVSRGYEDINALFAEITFVDAEKKPVGRIVTPRKPLKALATENLVTYFNTTGLLSGNYLAKAVVSYDTKQKRVNTSFRIGNVDLSLQNYSQLLEQGFQDFVITVSNNWGNTLNNVYARVIVNDQEILQTPTIILDPWEEGVLKGIIKVDFPPGSYSGKIILFFEGEHKEIPITLEVVAPPSLLEPPRDYTLLISTILLIVIAIVALIYFMFQQKKRGDF